MIRCVVFSGIRIGIFHLVEARTEESFVSEGKRARSSLLHHVIPGSSGESSPSRPPVYTSPTPLSFPGPLAEPLSASVSTSATAVWTRETEGDWQSKEMKASIARARALYMAKWRGQMVG
jgi:hypothetical protein